MTALSPVDVMILAVLALSMLFGALRGLVSEVLGLVVWIAAFALAWRFGGEVALDFAPWLHNRDACLVAGYVSCFVGVLVLGALAGWLMRRFLGSVGLRGVDRFLGMLFGLARGVVMVAFVVFVLGFTAVPREAAWWHQSVLLPAFQDAAGWAGRELPPDVAQRVEATRQALPTLPTVPTSALPRLLSPAAAPAGSEAAGRARGHGPTRADVGQ